jgi:hypothetical protein
MVHRPPDRPVHEPRTTFWFGEGDLRISVTLSDEVGKLLFSEGFWEYCKTNVPPGWNPIQFNGPWEGGWIDVANLDAFIGAIRLWSFRYEGMEGPVRSPWGWDDSSSNGIELSPGEMRAAFAEIEALALRATEANQSLFFET